MKTKKKTTSLKHSKSYWRYMGDIQRFIRTLENGYTYAHIKDIEIRGRGIGSPILTAFLIGYHWNKVKHSALTHKFAIPHGVGFGIEGPTDAFQKGERNLFMLEFKKRA